MRHSSFLNLDLATCATIRVLTKWPIHGFLELLRWLEFFMRPPHSWASQLIVSSQLMRHQNAVSELCTCALDFFNKLHIRAFTKAIFFVDVD